MDTIKPGLLPAMVYYVNFWHILRLIVVNMEPPLNSFILKSYGLPQTYILAGQIIGMVCLNVSQAHNQQKLFFLSYCSMHIFLWKELFCLPCTETMMSSSLVNIQCSSGWCYEARHKPWWEELKTYHYRKRNQYPKPY